MSEHKSECRDPRAIRAVHWNVHSWTDANGVSNLDAVRDLIEGVEADVVSLVEVDEPSPAAPVLHQVAEHAGYRSVFVPAFSYGKADARDCFGNAILTRLPILAVRQHPLLRPAPVYDGTEPSEPRVLLLVLVQSESRAVWFGSVHLPRTLSSARQASLAELQSVTALLAEPWLVLGDFNAPATSWVTVESNLVAHPHGSVPTYPAHAASEPIDYAIARRGQVVDCEVLASTGSDHLPVIARFQVD